MKHWINTNYKSIIIAAFLIPIITVAIVSISHVTKWYGISNPVSWAIYLSIGIEIAALSALAAISADMGKKVYFPFVIVTLVQFIGNIFFAYSYIDINSTAFKDWVDLVSPLVSFMGVEEGDLVGHKRFLSLFAGGMLPIISLSFLHMLVKFTEEDRKKEEGEKKVEPIPANHLMSEVSKIRLSEEDLIKLEKVLMNPPKPNEQLKKAAEEYNNTSIPTEEKKSIFPEEVEYPEEYNRPVYTAKEKQKQALIDMIEMDQKLGLYDPPYDKPLIKKEEITPALSDEEVREMFMDEWERKFDLVEDDDWGGLSNEELIGDDEILSTIEPTEEEEVTNFSTMEANNENISEDEVKTYQSQIEKIDQMLSEFENEKFSQEPTTLDTSIELKETSEEDEKKKS